MSLWPCEPPGRIRPQASEAAGRPTGLILMALPEALRVHPGTVGGPSGSPIQKQ
jgi:hypothetical protein